MSNHERILFGFLEYLGCKEHPHGDKTLFDHLVGTYRILLEKDAPWEVAVAGLFHAVYGTTSYPIAVVSHEDRDKIRSMIGEKPEELAFLFGTMPLPRREHIRDCADPETREALLLIDDANALEMEPLPDNVIPLRPRHGPFNEVVNVSLEETYNDFLYEMKASVHDQLMAMWRRNLLERTELDEDMLVAEEVAKVVIYQGMLSLAANYASELDQEYDAVFLGVGSAKDLFLNYYEQDMEGEYDG